MGDGAASAHDGDGGRTGASATIFVTDASVEAERAATALRGRGYHVVDVPLSLLVSRVAAQRPSLVILDADSEGAGEVVSRLRAVPGAELIEVLFVGHRGRAMSDTHDAIIAGGSAFFPRPVDIEALVRKALVLSPVEGDPRTFSGEPSASPTQHPSSRPSGQPVSQPVRSRPGNTDASALGSIAGPPSVAPPALLDAGLEGALWGQPQVPSAVGQLSEELQGILARAEDRIDSGSFGSSEPPSPEDEVDAVLPAEFLMALEEPLDFDDEDAGSDVGPSVAQQTPLPEPARSVQTSAQSDDEGPQTTRPPRRGARPAEPAPESLSPQTSAEPRPSPRPSPSLPSGPPPRPSVEPLRPSSPSARIEPPPLPLLEQPDDQVPSEQRLELTVSGGRMSQRRIPGSEAGAPPTPVAPPLITTPPPTPAVQQAVRSRTPTPEEQTPPPFAPPPPLASPVVSTISAALQPGEPLRVVGRCIAERSSGSLCFDNGQGLRRLVLRDGDLVTAGSSFDDETLVAYLVSRGELPRDTYRKLVGRVPPFGRHAGAALVAHGHLGQDRLWEVLRGHAEWLLGKMLTLEQGSCSLEEEPPGRLKHEPSVFGGSTGAETLVEVVRRVVPVEVATSQLGGAKARLVEGARRRLLSECALPARETEVVEKAAGVPIAALVELSGAPDFACALLALRALSVVDTLSPAAREPSVPPPRPRDPLDDEALRERVRARLELVEEGDYFAVLGVPRTSTPYEIKRAYIDLRKAFDPPRVLTAATADLMPSLRVILEVLDEAYEILRDTTRRERYLRAISAPAPADR